MRATLPSEMIVSGHSTTVYALSRWAITQARRWPILIRSTPPVPGSGGGSSMKTGSTKDFIVPKILVDAIASQSFLVVAIRNLLPEFEGREGRFPGASSVGNR